jgi:hypothetical protein
VIAYSSFPNVPPADSKFGRPGTGVSLQSDQHAKVNQAVLCTNPADLSGGTAALTPYFLASTFATPGAPVTTPWVSYPNLYTASCKSADGATWLQVTADSQASDPRPRVVQLPDPTWGYHLADVNLALGNLVEDVQQQEANYTRVHG